MAMAASTGAADRCEFGEREGVLCKNNQECNTLFGAFVISWVPSCETQAKADNQACCCALEHADMEVSHCQQEERERTGWLLWQVNALQRTWGAVQGLLGRLTDAAYQAVQPYNLTYLQVPASVGLWPCTTACHTSRAMMPPPPPRCSLSTRRIRCARWI